MTERSDCARWLTLEDAARRANVSLRTVYRWTTTGGLESVKRDGAQLIDERVLAQFLEGARPTRTRNAPGARDAAKHLLDAALSVAEEEGAHALTLDRVAQRAGMSLGGVTYHYPTKEALLAALCDLFVTEVETAWSAAERAGQDVVQAYVALSLMPERDLARTRSLVAALLGSPELQARVRRRVQAWYRKLARHGPDAVRACLAADALWMFDVLGLAPLSLPARRELFAG